MPSPTRPFLLFGAILLWLGANICADAAILYVKANSASPAPPFTSWGNAARTIQDAVDAASVGDEIVVTNGVYETGGRAVYGTMTNRVAVTRAVTVRSVNGPEVTMIRGYQVSGTTNGVGAVRCAYLTNGAVLAGFTLTNGASMESGDYVREQTGGAVWCESASALLTNCTLTGNSAHSGGAAYSGTLDNCTLTGNTAKGQNRSGGAAYFSTLKNCTLSGNSAAWGGAASESTLNRCMLVGNSVNRGGGAAYSSTLSNCLLMENSAQSGGGAASSTLNNCTLTGNFAGVGGGVIHSVLKNCMLTRNTADNYGGGAYGGTLDNCTLARNSATRGGGASDSMLNNCIVYYNDAFAGANYEFNGEDGGLSYCCTMPLPPSGMGNISSEPIFVELDAGNFRLAPNSPCINAGDNLYASGTTDLDGHPRVVSGTIDIGAYEFLSAVPVPVIAVEQPVNADLAHGESRHFGEVTIGSSGSLTFTVKNRGTADLTGWDITVDGPDAGIFIPAAISVAPIAPGGSTTFTVRFMPTSLGVKSAVLHIASDDPQQNPFDISLAGTCPLVTEAWAQRYNSVGSDYAAAVAVDADGNVIVTGSDYSGASNWDFYTAKYAAADGALVWEKRGPTNNEDHGFAVAVDGDGNVVVTGLSEGQHYTAKLAAADGIVLWEKRRTGPRDFNSNAMAVSVDGSGNVVVTGASGTVKYAGADGSLLWQAGAGTAVAVDRWDNVVVTGPSSNGKDFDYQTVKYASATGNLLWQKRYNARVNGPALGQDIPKAVALDRSGNAIVTGYSSNGTNTDYYTIKYAAANGAVLWQKRYNGPANRDDYARAVAVDSDGNVIVTGSSGILYGYDSFTVKYAANGAVLWENRHDNGEGYAVAVDANGNVVVAASSGSGGNEDYHVAKYAAMDGWILWERQYNNPNGGRDLPYSLALGPQGTVAVTGQSTTVVYRDSLSSTSSLISFAALKGNYVGLITNVQSTAWDRSGSFNLTVASKGTYSGKVSLGGATYSVSGVFDQNLGARNRIVRRGTNELLVTWQLTEGLESLQGAVSNASFISTLAGWRSGFGPTTAPTNFLGRYNLIVSGGTNTTITPFGHSFANLQVAKNGNVTIKGRMADSTPFAQKLPLSTSGELPIYRVLYSGKGSVFGWLTLLSDSTTDVQAQQICWTKTSAAGGKLYRDGFTNRLHVLGSRYSAPPTGARILNFSNAILRLDTGDLSTSVTNDVTLNNRNQIVVTGVNPNRLATSVSLPSGRFGGVFRNSTSGSRNTIWGVFLPRQNIAAGFFVGRDQSGSVRLDQASELNFLRIPAAVTNGLAFVRYVNVNSMQPAPPYTSWATAARTIQDAIDVAAPGDEIVVTNGVYDTGGRAVHGTMTNRVAVSKPVVVRSVNGPEVTAIRGYQLPETTNGNGAIRCVYLASGAVLSGFTLADGGAQSTTGGTPSESLVCGGILWSESRDALATNCLIKGGRAHWGGGTFGGTLKDCRLIGNSASAGGAAYRSALEGCWIEGNSVDYYGGGVLDSALIGCVLTNNRAANGGGAFRGILSDCHLVGNFAKEEGGGANRSELLFCAIADNIAGGAGGGSWDGTLSTCWITGNSAKIGGGNYIGTLQNCTISGNSAGSVGGVAGGALYNCIIYYNRDDSLDGASRNYGLGSFGLSEMAYCCTTPLPSGDGNFADEPELASASRLSASSPCRSAGTVTRSAGWDVDGEDWSSPPSMGCDEPVLGAMTGPLALSIRVSNTRVATGLDVELRALIEGRVSASQWEFEDGTTLSNRPYAMRRWLSTGDYPVVLRAFNETYPSGVTSTVTVHVVEAPIHYVAASSANPSAPYTSWETAAATIQDAVNAATIPGAVVVVTNGIYRTGGMAVGDDTFNRVAILKRIKLLSVNGPEVTIIDGGGSGRCVYLSNDVEIVGFTLTNGIVGRDAGGGGAWCKSGSAVLSNCVIAGNSALDEGIAGGVWSGTLKNCVLVGNTAAVGGAAYESRLLNCHITQNSANVGGGVHFSYATNSSLTGNAAMEGGGASGSVLINCNLSHNQAEVGGGADGLSKLQDCVLLNNYASFTGGGAAGYSMLTNCFLAGNNAREGGGAYNAILSSCVLSNNSAEFGAGAYDSTLYQCSLIENRATYGGGGGACSSTLDDCEIRGNTADYGGGVNECNLSRCVVTRNVAWSDQTEDGGYGGGASASRLSDCVVSLNFSADNGGGVVWSSLTNCLVTDNLAVMGGGCSGSELVGCTVVGNYAAIDGGGTFEGWNLNTIVLHNMSGIGNGSNHSTASFESSCTLPLPFEGLGNIANTPLFLNMAAGNFRLQPDSPCINAGRNATSPAGLDLDGRPRVTGGTVDIGAYEFQTPQSTISYAWLQQYGLPNDGSADHSDTDGDRSSNELEWRAGTDPKNAASVFKLLTPVKTPAGVDVRWNSVLGRTYYIERSVDAEGLKFVPWLEQIAGQPGTTSHTDTNNNAAGAIIYRVGVKQ